MSAATLLALICVIWPILCPIWERLDKPYTVTYRSQFYRFAVDGAYQYVKFGLGVALLAGAAVGHLLALLVVIGSAVVLVWGFFSPTKIDIHDWFFGLVAAAAGITAIVAAIIVL